MIDRFIQKKIADDFERGKVIVVMGARQVGKTTMIQQLSSNGKKLLLNCDDAEDREVIENKSSAVLKNIIANYNFVFIDEAQRVPEIGLTLKKIGDLKLKTHVIVSGSSSFELSGNINEPATGRLIEHQLFPFSLGELAAHTSEHEERKMLESRIIYGTYPDVVNFPGEARRTLSELTNNYLYKDILSYKGIKKPEILQKLVKALALQVGSEVSYNELSNLVGIDKATVETYIGLLSKCYIVFKLDSFSRNSRNEIKKGKKIYFWDNGIRNAVISNFAPLDSRNDKGALWENLMISERMKRNLYLGNYAQLYFWRTIQMKEIDLVEELDGQLSTFEFKEKPGKVAKMPVDFLQHYPNATFSTITPDNYWDYVRM
ncbi:MAG: ATP-binding protein [Bacteroidales bacterium]|nr:ATP-binding protein [Bacteroidales bacterium]